jgi:hypothetical protein
MCKFVDFAEIRERLPIEDAAEMLPVKWERKGEQLRATCPVHGGERGLAVTPAKGLFICQASREAKKGGDCIALCAHVMQTTNYEAAQYLAKQIGMNSRTVDSETVYSTTVSKNRATAPQNEKREPTRQFDPDEYLSKLTYSEEIGALGISEADAQALGIGFVNTGLHRGRIAIALRWPSGEIAGFGSVEGGTIKLPNKFIPPKVHVLKRA